LAASTVSVAQRAPQSVWPPGHVTRHAPPKHTCPAAQRAPHMPQLAGSDWTSTQAPPHETPPAPQPQTPAVHAPLAHVRPQRPQWSGSVCVSTHAPLHAAVPAGQVATHDPAAQS